jgi:serine/threonine-protein phosphatase 6 regulatory ankyrin repeat subunit B
MFEWVQGLIEAGTANEAEIEGGWSPLQRAAAAGDLPAVELLLDHGADLRYVDRDGWTACSRAAQSSNGLIMQRLIAADPSLADRRTLKGNTPLMIAAMSGHVEVVRMLATATAGVDINATTNKGISAVLFASQRGHVHVVQLLIQQGADINLTMVDGTSALMVSAWKGHRAVAALLLESKANPNVQINTPNLPMMAETGSTALMISAREGCTKIVLHLLQSKANPNHQESQGWTALMFAAKHGRVGVLRTMLGADGSGSVKCDVDTVLAQTNQDGHTAATLSEANNHTKCTELLNSFAGNLESK